MIHNFNIYYILINGHFRCFNNITKEINTFQQLPREKGKLIGNFAMPKKLYDENDDGLMKYVNDFNHWANQLQSNYIVKIDYRKYLSHTLAAVNIHKLLVDEESYKNHDEIDGIESKWIELTYNAGLMYCEKQEKPINTYSYDYNFFYPRFVYSR